MILEQPISAVISLSLITVIVILLFTLKFFNFKKSFLKNFYELPSIIVAGPKLSGKKSIIRNITRDEIISHPFENNLKISYLFDGDRKIQLISFPYNFAFDFVKSEDFEKINKKLLINIFDVSPKSDEIENQIKGYNKISPKFNGIDKIIVANKVDIKDNKKLNKLKIKYKKIYKTSSITNDGLDKLKEHIISS